ncbi:MAG: PTS sugar transporter subunit IIA, partial [Ileibacterium sp.]|nr:PTS sugar transporter subunit IIA [Ileibacterium sp.]
MKIRELLAVESIDLNAAPKTKQETIDQAVDLMVKSGKISDKAAYKKEVEKRETEGTTGVGEGIAIPHGRNAAVKKPGLAA